MSIYFGNSFFRCFTFYSPKTSPHVWKFLVILMYETVTFVQLFTLKRIMDCESTLQEMLRAPKGYTRELHSATQPVWFHTRHTTEASLIITFSRCSFSYQPWCQESRETGWVPGLSLADWFYGKQFPRTGAEKMVGIASAYIYCAPYFIIMCSAAIVSIWWGHLLKRNQEVWNRLISHHIHQISFKAL